VCCLCLIIYGPWCWRLKLLELDLGGNSAETFGFGPQSRLDSVLFFSSQRAVAQFVGANLEPAHLGGPG